MKYSTLAVFFFIVLTGIESKSRSFRKIQKSPGSQIHKSSQNVSPLKPLKRKQCVTAARKIIDSYGSVTFRTNLSANFPNADLLLDSLQRATFKASNIRLNLESIGRVTPGPWIKISGNNQEVLYQSTCTVEVQTRLSFDNAQTGDHVVKNPGRSQWQIKFVAKER